MGIATCITVFFFNDTATTEIYTLSLHDALPICVQDGQLDLDRFERDVAEARAARAAGDAKEAARLLGARSEEHTSELQSRQYLVCRLLLEKILDEFHAWLCTSTLPHP